jgi:hypothetical protein
VRRNPRTVFPRLPAKWAVGVRGMDGGRVRARYFPICPPNGLWVRAMDGRRGARTVFPRLPAKWALGVRGMDGRRGARTVFPHLPAKWGVCVRGTLIVTSMETREVIFALYIKCVLELRCLLRE